MPLADADKKHFQVVVNGTYAAAGAASKVTANVFHYRRTSFGTTLDYTELTTALHTKFKAAWKAAVSASWTWDSTFVRNVDSPSDGGQTTGVTEVGGVAGEPYPPFAAMLISKKSGKRGKSFRGRMFVAGIAESAAASSLLTAGELTLLQAMATALTGVVTTAAGVTYVPFLLSTKNSDITVEPATIVGADIISFLAHQQMSSQTSRRLHSV